MNKKIIFSLIGLLFLGAIGVFIYPKLNPSQPERKILYWTDPMIQGDRSDRPGKSPMGMERVPVYEVEQTKKPSSSVQEDYYTCPMHPSVHKGSPGSCPVCGMTLVKKSSEKEMTSEESHTIGAVAISPSKQVLANVSTTKATRKNLTKEIRTVGVINYAETNYRRISTRFPGRFEKLYVSFTGQRVKQGDPVAEMYSPEAISAQQEYLLAKDSYEQVKDVAGIVSSGASSLLDQAKQKLLLWGFTEKQINELEKSKEVKNQITIYSPISGTVLKKNVDVQQYANAGESMYEVADLSTVWLYADVYEYEIQSLKIGQQVEARSDAYPGEKFNGTISFISPTIDPSSRTVRVRVDVPNAKEKLKPEMYVNAVLKATLPSAVVVPLTALLSSGDRQVVWVQTDENVFEPHNVKVGERTADAVQILNGIEVDEVVVTSGGYLLDSESQLQAASGASSKHNETKN